MATKITMENPQTGETTSGFYGFSWTTLFFGAFPALFRKDFITFIGLFVILIILAFVSLGIAPFFVMLIWSFMYNKYYTTGLLKKGFVFSATHTENELAAGRLGLKLNSHNCKTVAAQ
ncbi:hypothetical protein [Candidatus Pantoea deserta]|uniref:hypothetical protein n=1 Tax=Candidatus Pantoea deserta TaxID=1869313 RepID=UPI0018F52FCC|nr:hypothetical protein [Pantoea deserta]